MTFQPAAHVGLIDLSDGYSHLEGIGHSLHRGYYKSYLLGNGIGYSIICPYSHSVKGCGDVGRDWAFARHLEDDVWPSSLLLIGIAPHQIFIVISEKLLGRRVDP